MQVDLVAVEIGVEGGAVGVVETDGALGCNREEGGGRAGTGGWSAGTGAGREQLAVMEVDGALCCKPEDSSAGMRGVTDEECGWGVVCMRSVPPAGDACWDAAANPPPASRPTRAQPPAPTASTPASAIRHSQRMTRAARPSPLPACRHSQRMTRARCPIMPGLCSVGWRLVSMKSPSSIVRYTICSKAIHVAEQVR